MTNFNRFKTNSYGVCGSHSSSANYIRGLFTSKDTKDLKMLKGNCVMCKRNKSMAVSDRTIEAEGLKDFFRSVGKATFYFGKKVANNPKKALEKAS